MSREPLVSWLDEPRTAGRGLAGGKAASLARLAGHGLPVPAGFVLTVAARAAPWDDVVPALAAAYERLGGGAVAVRSSAVAEDSPDSSFAGQFETVLGVAGLEPVAAAVRRCWRSGEADGVRRYRELRGEDGGQAAMAVLVQRMVAPWAAGVMTTLNPTTGDRSEVYVEACLGLGLGAVSGECPVDRYRVDKVRLEVRERAVVEKHSAFFAGADGGVP